MPIRQRLSPPLAGLRDLEFSATAVIGVLGLFRGTPAGESRADVGGCCDFSCHIYFDGFGLLPRRSSAS